MLDFNSCSKMAGMTERIVNAVCACKPYLERALMIAELSA